MRRAAEEQERQSGNGPVPAVVGGVQTSKANQRQMSQASELFLQQRGVEQRRLLRAVVESRVAGPGVATDAVGGQFGFGGRPILAAVAF